MSPTGGWRPTGAGLVEGAGTQSSAHKFMNGSRQDVAVTVLLGGLSAVFFGIGDLLGGVGVRKSGRSGAAVGMSIVATSV